MIEGNGNGEFNNQEEALEKDNVIVTLDDDGEEHVFAIADVFNMNDSKYIILVPLGSDGELLDDYMDDDSEDVISDEDDTIVDDTDDDDTEDDEDAEEVEAFVFKVVIENGEEVFEEIENEEEAYAVMEEWEKRNPDAMI